MNMPRSLPEWIGATDDTPAPDRVKERVRQRYANRCPVCTRQLRAGHWDLDHIVALANKGENRESNMQPVCRSPCHRDKTLADVTSKSRAYQVSAKHHGSKHKRRTITAWRKFDGRIVRAPRLR
jgi:5-methylcytosine-specific restriction endonuclease McrA